MDKYPTISMDKLREDFNNNYDGGYTFEEVKDVMTWAIEWTVSYLQSKES